MPSVRYAWAIRSQNDGEDFGTIQSLDGPFSAQSSMFPKGEVRSVPAVLELLWVNEAGCLTAGGGAPADASAGALAVRGHARPDQGRHARPRPVIPRLALAATHPSFGQRLIETEIFAK